MNAVLIFQASSIAMLLVVVFLIREMNILKKNHFQKMISLQALANSLDKKQELLNQKININNQYKTNYNNDLKIISNEIFELQKIFIDKINTLQSA